MKTYKGLKMPMQVEVNLDLHPGAMQERFCNRSDCSSATFFVTCPVCLYYSGNLKQFTKWLKERKMKDE